MIGGVEEERKTTAEEVWRGEGRDALAYLTGEGDHPEIYRPLPEQLLPFLCPAF